MMGSAIICTPADAAALPARIMAASNLPVTVTWVAGEKRTDAQNGLQQKWMEEIARQAADGNDAEYWRGYCKLTFGVPIRQRDDEIFAEKFGRIVAPLAYAERIECMCQPIDMPVTRDMTKRQKREYLDAVERHFRSAGFILTDPEARKYEAEFGA